MAATSLSREEIDEFLESEGTGVLALSDGTETYAVPMSFGYDGEDLYFQYVYPKDSRKVAFSETTDTATFTAYAKDGSVRSVIVRGPLEVVPQNEEVHASIAIIENASTPALNVTTEESLEDVAFTYYRLTPREVSGRRFE